MGVYFGETEITGMHFGEQEITEIFFGNTEIFSVWAEYDGTLPAQYSANGSMLADYRIYGAAGGVGDGTVNLFDNSKIASGQARYGIISSVDDKIYVEITTSDSSGAWDANSSTFNDLCDELEAGESYYLSAKSTGTNKYIYITGAGVIPFNAPFILTQEMLSGVVMWYASGVNTSAVISDFMIAKGSTAPTSYVPYGYGVDMSISDGTTSTTTPIYIGSSPLGEDEYVDYGEGKIYRMSGGVLTPTDPPVPLPALPTCDGVNIVDYAGQSAAVPSKFTAKYRKEGF